MSAYDSFGGALAGSLIRSRARNRPRSTPPGVTAPPRPRGPTAPSAGDFISREADRIINEMLAELGLARDSARRDAERNAESEMQRARALSEALTALGTPGIVSDIYSRSAGSIGALAGGFSQQVQGLAAQHGAEQANMVSGTGQEGAVRNAGVGMGDVLYGQQGFIPARALEQTGSAFAAQAALQPGFALQFGQLAASDVMQQFIDEVLPDFTDQEAQIRMKRSSVESELKDKSKAEARDLYEAGLITQREFARRMGVKNWKRFPNTMPGEGSDIELRTVGDTLIAIDMKTGKSQVVYQGKTKPNVRTVQLADGRDILIDLNTGKITQLGGPKAGPPPTIRGSNSQGYTIFDQSGNVIGTVKGTGGGTSGSGPLWKRHGFKSAAAMNATASALAKETQGAGRDRYGKPKDPSKPAMSAEQAYNHLVSQNIPPAIAARALRRYYPKAKFPKAKPVKDGQPNISSDSSWGGSYAIAQGYSNIAREHGLTVSSTKRDTKNTASGGVSDHWKGSTSAYAYDLSGSVANMDRGAMALLNSLGYRWDGKSSVVKNFYVGGYRIQVLYRTNVGGNHYDHIHIGVRKN